MTVAVSEYVEPSSAWQESVNFVCLVIASDVLPLVPEVAPLHVSPFVPVTAHDETYEMFQ